MQRVRDSGIFTHAVPVRAATSRGRQAALGVGVERLLGAAAACDGAERGIEAAKLYTHRM